MENIETLDRYDTWEYILIIISRAAIIISALLAMFIVTTFFKKMILFFLILWMFLYGAGALISKVDPKYHFLKYPVLISDFISIYLIYYFTGSLNSPFHYLFLLYIFTTTIFYGPRYGLFTGFISAIGILLSNYLPEAQVQNSEALFGHAILYFLTGIFFALLGYLKDIMAQQKIEHHQNMQIMISNQEDVKRKITFLKNLGHSMTKGEEYEKVSTLFLEAMLDIPEVDELLLRMIDGEVLKARVFIGELSESLARFNVKLQEGWAGKVMQAETSIIINDTSKDFDLLNKLYLDTAPEYLESLKNITALVAVPITCCKQTQGVLFALNKSQKNCFNNDHSELLETMASAIGMFIEREMLNLKIKKNLYEAVHVLSRAVDAKDNYTHNHSINVANFAVLIGKNMGLSGEEVQKLYFGGLLHDVGKIGVQDNIINKHDKLSNEEWEEMKRHSLIGGEMLSDLHTFEEIIEMVIHHHEREDGFGYPDQLSGKELSLYTRILIVADAFDAMISDRPYRKALPLEVVKEQLKTNINKQFNGEIVEVLLNLIEEKLEIHRITRINEIAI